MSSFEFNDYRPFTDGEIEVVVRETYSGIEQSEFVAAYHFDIRLPARSETIGAVNLRIGNSRDIVMYAGHIGYGIDPAYRGHRYAAKACNLISQVALDHGLKTLWITCNPDNWASRRTCEILGCKFVEIIDLPEDTDMYRAGERRKCRYRWDLE